MTLTIIATLWLITVLSPHPSDVDIAAVAACFDTDNRMTYFAYNSREIVKDQQEYRFSAPMLPANSECTVHFELRRNETDDPTKAYVAAVVDREL